MESPKNLLDEISQLNNELINSQRELHKKNAELKNLNDYKNEILGMVAHDLRNPISIVLMYTKFLNEKLETLSILHQRNFLLKIIASSEFMLNLLSDLLDFTSIETGKLRLHLESVDLKKFIAEGIKNIQIIANTKKISLQILCEENSLFTEIDKNRFEQVVTNLVSNAIKYSPIGSKIEIGLNKKGNEVIFFVKDYGPGIPKNEMSLLFKPFCKMSTHPTGGEKSTGLGLTIAKKIVDSHHGRIWVESKDQQGACFFVAIPIQKTSLEKLI